MSGLGEIIISTLLVIGGLFGLIGSFGLLKLRDPMQRLHAPTKATTVGVGAALIASALDLVFVTGHATWQEIMVAVFLFITAPLSALYLAKSHIAKTIDRSVLPPTATEAPWAELRRAKEP
ncbi:MAG: Na+/H+ antiporter subunit G [Cypionkella sp.]|jgi:multicomponent K+:H+ antiporter subunit G